MRLLIAAMLLVKLASVYMITHWIIWCKSTDTPALGFIESTIIPDVGRNKACRRSPIETEWCCATADHKAQQSAQFTIATPARQKSTPPREDQPTNQQNFSRTADATLNRTCQDCAVVADQLRDG
jgi:hypothetical protein